MLEKRLNDLARLQNHDIDVKPENGKSSIRFEDPNSVKSIKI